MSDAPAARVPAPRDVEQGGWLLASLIVILSSVFVALAGASLALGEHHRVISLSRHSAQAVYLAQAGVMQALYDVRQGQGVTLQEYVVDPGPLPGTGDDDVFILGGKAADFLLVNMLPATLDQGVLSGRRDRLRQWRLYNALRRENPPSGLPVRITHMTVSWANPQPSEGVVRIELDGRRVWPTSGTLSAPQPSGRELNIVDTRVRPTTQLGNNTVWFSTNRVMPAKAFVDVICRMSDHVPGGDPTELSLRRARYSSAAGERTADLTMKSTGESRRGLFPFPVWRRLQAEYRLTGATLDRPGIILSYRVLSRKSP